ncbi:unnamed protein product [Sphagnum troendelagicum]
MTTDCRVYDSSIPVRGTTIQQPALAAEVSSCARRKQVPHAKDSPRPAQKGKHVRWENQQQLELKNGDVVADEEEEEQRVDDDDDDSTGRRAVMKQGRKPCMKGKLHWLFEQDRLYWEVPIKEKAGGGAGSSSPPPHDDDDAASTRDDTAAAAAALLPKELLLKKKKNVSVLTRIISPSGKVPWSPVEHLSDSVNIGEDGDLQSDCNSSYGNEDDDDGDDDSSSNFDLEMSHLEMDAPEIEVFVTSTPQAPGTISVLADESSESTDASGFGASSVDHEGSTCFETRNVKKEQAWQRQAAVLKARCEILKMEKELAQQRWKEGCEQMTQAVEMAHSLRAAVESILEPMQKKRVAVSEDSPPPKTPSSCMAEEEKKRQSEEGLLVERLERKQRTCSNDRSGQQKLDSRAELLQLESRAMVLQNRTDIPLQHKSQLMNKDSSSFNSMKGYCEQQKSQHTRKGMMRSASISSMSMKRIEEENRVSALDEAPLNSMSTKAPKSKKAIDHLLKQKEHECILEEAQAKEVQTKETVRKILAQIQVEAEQWTQVQDVLKHVCTEMATLQQARQGWEKRALNAESQAAAWQLKGDEWRVKAQTAQQRIKEVELQMVQLQETVQDVNFHHAQEQNQWLDVGSSVGGPTSIIGYTLALEPISNMSSSDSCGCSSSMPTEFETCRSCGKLRCIKVEDRHDLHIRPHNSERHSTGGPVPRLPSPCKQHHAVAHGSVPRFLSPCVRQPTTTGSVPRFPSPCVRHATTGSVPRVPSPCVQHATTRSVLRAPIPYRSTSQETCELGKVRQKYHNAKQHQHQHQKLMPVADNPRQAAQPGSNQNQPRAKSEEERSLPQEEELQQTPTTRNQPNSPQDHIVKPRNEQQNMKGSAKSFAGMQRKGGAIRGQSPMRKLSNSSSAGSLQGSSSHSASNFNALQRAPLKEKSANIIISGRRQH